MIDKQEHNGFYVTESEDGMGRVMVLTGAWRDEFAEFLTANDIRALRLSGFAGWYDTDIEFVRRLWSLKSLEVYSDTLRDLGPLQHLGGLELLSFDVKPRSPIDFGAFENLRICKIDTLKNVEGLLSHPRLEYLNIDYFPGEDFRELSCPRMRQLQLNNSRQLRSTIGIEKLPLDDIEFYSCSKLEDLSELAQLQTLVNFEMTSCRSVRDLSPLAGLEKLTRVYMENCGELDSLAPLADCPSLKVLMFIGEIKVLDGDFEPLLRAPVLEKMWYANRRHYSHTREEFKAALQLRRESSSKTLPKE